MNGIVLLDKGEGFTSQAAVTRVKHLFGAKKAGHTGTLDPMATGLLPILLDGATRAGEFLLSSEKHYEATLRLGITTDTEDVTGRVLTESDKIPAEEEVFAVLDEFRGEIMQTPPMYSALKVGGKKLVDLARVGTVVERTPRPITVYELSAAPLTKTDYRLSVRCSKGTYIRTLCADIGARLGSGGAMATLRRVTAGGFDLSLAHTLEEFSAMTEEERRACVLPVERIFDRVPGVKLSAFYANLAHHGCPISLCKIGKSFPVGQTVTLWDEGGFFAVAETVAENPQLPGTGPALKPIRQF